MTIIVFAIYTMAIWTFGYGTGVLIEKRSNR